MARCSTIKPEGTRCGGQAMRESEWCFSHHPDHAEGRRQRASKGGKRGGRGRPQAELGDIKRRLSDLTDDVLEGRQDRGNAAVAGQLFNTYLRAVSVELRAREQLELIERLEVLEEALAQKRNSYGA